MQFSSLVQLAPWYTTDGSTIRSHRASTLAGVIAGIAQRAASESTPFLMLTAWSGRPAADDDGYALQRHRLTFELQPMPACTTHPSHHWKRAGDPADNLRREHCSHCGVAKETETVAMAQRTHTTVRYFAAHAESAQWLQRREMIDVELASESHTFAPGSNVSR